MNEEKMILGKFNNICTCFVLQYCRPKLEPQSLKFLDPKWRFRKRQKIFVPQNIWVQENSLLNSGITSCYTSWYTSIIWIWYGGLQWSLENTHNTNILQLYTSVRRLLSVQASSTICSNIFEYLSPHRFRKWKNNSIIINYNNIILNWIILIV